MSVAFGRRLTAEPALSPAATEPCCTVSAHAGDGQAQGCFFIDCEFDGHGGPLLSIGIVREDGTGAHIKTNARAYDPWVIDNVLPIMDAHNAELDWTVPVNDVGTILRHVIGSCLRPVIVADSPVDIGRFCAAISTSPRGGWASAEYARMTFEVHNVDCYPTTLPGAVQHNAWWDAMALRHKLASADTHPQGGDSAETEAPALLSGAVQSAETADAQNTAGAA